MSAVLSADGVYRYRLDRTWDVSLPRVVYIMLNPSTADADTDDPTIRKCRGFAGRLGFGSLTVVNLFAFRSTDPKGLLRAGVDPAGPDNDRVIAGVATDPGATLIAAWGAWARRPVVARRIRGLLAPGGALADRNLYCIGVANGGTPRHPLMTPYDTPMLLWKKA